MVVRVLLLTVAALLLGGCGGGDDEPSVTVATTTTATATTPPVLEGASTAPVTWTSPITETALLTDVRVAAQPGYDRVVFEFRNGVPGYDVRYVEPPILEDGSGEEVPVSGAAALVVRMEPALDADLTQESAPRTYTGPARISPSTPVIVELVRAGGFEAVLTWAIGVDEERPFRVTRLEEPARIVIDVSSS